MIVMGEHVYPRPVRNYTPGRGPSKPMAIVLHLMGGSLDGTWAWFDDPDSHASAHYGIGRNGRIEQYVEDLDTAWHSGRVKSPTWPLLQRIDLKSLNPNRWTIGIEHEGRIGQEWTAAQVASSSALLAYLCDRYAIPCDDLYVAQHQWINSLHACPGPVAPVRLILSNAQQLLAATPVAKEGS